MIGGRGAAPPDGSLERQGPAARTTGPDLVTGEAYGYQIRACAARNRGPFPVACGSTQPPWRGQEETLRFFVDVDRYGFHTVVAKWGGGKLVSVDFSTRADAQAELLRWLAWADRHDQGNRLRRRGGGR